MFFAFEEQSCLILDSIFNPLFKLQILDSICRFYVLGLPIFYIELNEDSQTELNKYNKNESVLKWELNWLLTYVNSEQCYILQGRPGGGGGGVVAYQYTWKKFAKIPKNTPNSSEYTQNYTQVYFIPEIQSDIPHTRI